MSAKRACWTCGGTGRVGERYPDRRRCPDCEGKGVQLIYTAKEEKS